MSKAMMLDGAAEQLVKRVHGDELTATGDALKALSVAVEYWRRAKAELDAAADALAGDSGAAEVTSIIDMAERLAAAAERRNAEQTDYQARTVAAAKKLGELLGCDWWLLSSRVTGQRPMDWQPTNGYTIPEATDANRDAVQNFPLVLRTPPDPEEVRVAPSEIAVAVRRLDEARAKYAEADAKLREVYAACMARVARQRELYEAERESLAKAIALQEESNAANDQ